VILPGSNEAQVTEIANRVCAATRDAKREHKGAPKGILTLSVGGATASSELELGRVLARADTGVYAAKEAGRDCFRIVKNQSDFAELSILLKGLV
jgi:GGDEF domain-containing protein